MLEYVVDHFVVTQESSGSSFLWWFLSSSQQFPSTLEEFPLSSSLLVERVNAQRQHERQKEVYQEASVVKESVWKYGFEMNIKN